MNVTRVASAAVLALALAAPAFARRAPTPAEQRQIAVSVRFFPTIGRRNEVRFAWIRVSTADPSYAAARVALRDPHGEPLGHLDAVLRRGGGWRVVFVGDGPPPCAAAPARVRLDLLGTRACARRP